MPLVSSLGQAEGVPELRAAEYPGAFDADSDDTIRKYFDDKTFGLVVKALTEPLTAAGAAAAGRNPREIVFKGTLEEVNRFFHDNLWTDGMSIIPPTVDRVEEFLRYTDRSPDEQIAVLPPGKLIATPWIIAANGVMAGCRPEHMPILIAIAEAMAEKSYNLEQLGNTGGENPFVVVNGPIAKQLNFDHSMGVGSRADTSNASIGRFVGLLIRNVAELRPGQQAMATFGYMIPKCFAEDEDAIYEIGWQPYHVRRGFDKNASTVTVGAFEDWGNTLILSGKTPQEFLKPFVDRMTSGAFKWAPFGDQQSWNIFLSAATARPIALGGFSPKDIAEYVWKESGLPTEWVRSEKQVYTGYGPHLFHIFVSGDPNRNRTMLLDSDYVVPATKEIQLPPNWNQLTAEAGYRPLEEFFIK